VSRYLGLDWGSKRTGVSISDDQGRLAVGYAIWPTGDVFPQLEKTMREEDIRLIVVGYPLTLRGEVGPKALEVDRFINRLERKGYVVHRWDERYTTQDVSRDLTRIGISQRKQRGKLDMSAAVLMLQGYLDAHPAGGEDESGG
jgi:putative holliday junction resolvase